MIDRQRDIFIKLCYITIDILVIYLSIFFACWIRRETLFFSPSFHDLFFNPENPFRIIFVFWIISTILFLNSNRLYHTRREVLESIEIWLIIKSVFFSSLVLVLFIYALKVEKFPRMVFAIAGISMATFFSLWRVLKRFFVEYLVVSGYRNVNVLIIGAGKVGIALAEEIKRRPGLGIKIVGFLDDFKKDHPVPGFKVLGKISDFVNVANKEFIGKIFITIHHDHDIFLSLLEQAKELGIAVRVVPQGFDLISSDFSKYNIGFIPILEYCDESNTKKQVGKRLFDFIVSLVLLVFLLPVFLVIVVLIKFDSPGPALYQSRRYGRKGNIFHMYKFRSMIHEADQVLRHLKDKNEVDGPIFKIRKDPRVTKFGRFLRKYSLDELPQLLNVLCGDMSLVGPRPLPIEQIEKEDLRQLKRLEVRPGITGLWQIRGRSDISFERLLRWDIWYINNWSFWLDLTILFLTIPVVFKGKGAY